MRVGDMKQRRKANWSLVLRLSEEIYEIFLKTVCAGDRWVQNLWVRSRKTP